MKHSSEILETILKLPEDQKLTVGEFAHLFGTRSLALMIFIFSIPHMVPIIEPPGISTIMGGIIIFFAFRIIFGGNKLWIPKKIENKSISQKFLKKSIKLILPFLKFIEKFIKPRLPVLFNKNGQRLIGLMIFLMALILAIPIPGGNFLPGIAIGLLALSLLEADGALAIIAMIFSVITIYIMYSVIVFAVTGIASWF